MSYTIHDKKVIITGELTELQTSLVLGLAQQGYEIETAAAEQAKPAKRRKRSKGSAHREPYYRERLSEEDYAEFLKIKAERKYATAAAWANKKLESK